MEASLYRCFFSSRRRHTRFDCDWSSDVCSSDLQRVHFLRVAAHPLHRIAHGRDVDHGGDAGELLHQHARRHERDLVIRELRRIPARQPLDLLGPHGASVLPAQQVLEQDFEGIRQAADREPALLQRVQAEDLEAPSSHCEAGPRTETVGRRHSTAFTSTTKYWVSPKQLVGMPMCCWYVSATRFPIDWLIRAATESSRTVK